jgi:hypothetical protein
MDDGDMAGKKLFCSKNGVAGCICSNMERGSKIGGKLL